MHHLFITSTVDNNGECKHKTKARSKRRPINYEEVVEDKFKVDKK